MSGITLFFDHIESYSEQLAVLDYGTDDNADSGLSSRAFSYAQLNQRVEHYRQMFTDELLIQGSAEANRRKIVIFKMTAEYDAIAQYLALLRLKVVMIIVSPDISEDAVSNISEAFNVNGVVGCKHCQLNHSNTADVAASLAIILPTSGTTGQAKFVALSYVNLQSNAESICAYLPIETSDRALCTLPFHYSYGLSVLHSHLLKGAALVLSPFTVMDRPFWQVLEDSKATSFAGVPYIYEMLERLRFRTKQHPSIRYFTQAGGKLSESLVRAFGEYAEEQGQQFFVMYGQTEATARMAYLDPVKVLSKPTSIGQAIPGGEFKIVEGELCYRGENVMLGYCLKQSDLASFPPIEWLKTGDLASMDDEGDFCITGRIKRMIKVFGTRFDLDALEHLLRSEGLECLCIGIDQQLTVAVSRRSTSADESAIKRILQSNACLHPSVIRVSFVEHLPINSNGKPDYPALAAYLGND